MPEEATRRLTDHLSQILLAHSESATENLRKEGIDLTRVHLVGNTMIDSVFRHLPAALARQPWLALGVEPERFALVTLHRPALVDNGDLFRRMVDALAELGRRLPVVFPLHPRTEARLVSAGLDRARLHDSELRFCPPLGYLE